MEAQRLAAWGPILEEIVADEATLAAVWADNEWFVPAVVRQAIAQMRPWWDAGALAALRARYPAVHAPKRVGLILAGNLPLVGLHDVLMVLLSGHHAVVKPSHKDRILLAELLKRSPEAIRQRVTWVDAVSPEAIDFLLATGSNATARQLADDFRDRPKLIRQNRFSLGLLSGTETESQLQGLARDILSYHGMGCRSVTSLLVPEGFDLKPLVQALEAMPSSDFAEAWRTVLRYERAVGAVLGVQEPTCSQVVIQHSQELRPPKIGVLNVVTYRDEAQRAGLLAAVRADLQCIVGEGYLPFGQAQSPALDDFADGIDTLELLANI